MIMGYILALIFAASILSAMATGSARSLSAALLSGAQSGVALAVSMAGSVCLWSGVGKVMEAGGISKWLSRLLRPLLVRIFPSAAEDPILAGDLSANICANILGLGNAATPMGIRAAKRLAQRQNSTAASDELCRLVVLNTASIQLIPANVASIRASLGAGAPFDILPAVWITSILSAGLGLGMAWVLGRVWKDG